MELRRNRDEFEAHNMVGGSLNRNVPSPSRSTREGESTKQCRKRPPAFWAGSLLFRSQTKLSQCLQNLRLVFAHRNLVCSPALYFISQEGLCQSLKSSCRNSIKK
jgi:hypothetical protein